MHLQQVIMQTTLFYEIYYSILSNNGMCVHKESYVISQADGLVALFVIGVSIGLPVITFDWE